MSFFSNFQKLPTCDNYIDSLVKSMAGLSMSASPSTPTLKRRLADIEDSKEVEEIVETKKKKKKKKKKRNKKNQENRQVLICES